MTKNSNAKVWLEKEGFLCIVYSGNITAESLSDGMLKAKELLGKKLYSEVYSIVVVEGASLENVKITPGEMGKLLTQVDFANIFGKVWVVGTSKITRGLLANLARPFFEDKVHFVDSVEEAKKQLLEAKQQ